MSNSIARIFGKGSPSQPAIVKPVSAAVEEKTKKVEDELTTSARKRIGTVTQFGGLLGEDTKANLARKTLLGQ